MCIMILSGVLLAGTPELIYGQETTGSFWTLEKSVPELSVQSTKQGIQISWNAVAGAEGYVLYRRIEKEKKWEKIGTFPPDTRQTTDSSVTPGQVYEYNLRVAGEHKPTAIENQIKTAVWEVSPHQVPAGTVLDVQAVEAAGIDKWFYTEPIPDEVFARMQGKSFGEDCTVPRSELRYIKCLHKDLEGNIKVGELVMNQKVADSVCNIFRQLYFLSYPIERMQLVDDYGGDDETSIMHNNTSAFNYRTVAGTNEISQHAYGLAIDINPYYNVYYVPSQNYIFPEDGWQYLDRDAEFPYKLEPGDPCYNLFTAAGFEWGGWWTYNTDYQHFQYTGE